MVRCSWSSVSEPGNSGRPVHISHSRQPMAHTSAHDKRGQEGRNGWVGGQHASQSTQQWPRPLRGQDDVGQDAGGKGGRVWGKGGRVWGRGHALRA
eukprot:355147-Chlamydomonas_euryale.AAC.4